MSDVITPAMDLHPQPAGGAPRPWAFPAPERTTLDNGLTVLTCHRPGQQVVAVEVLLDSPLDTEPEGLDGLATIMARAFSEGTDRDSAEEFAAELERCGATLDAFADHPGVRLSLEVPVSRLEKALGLLADALRAPPSPRPRSSGWSATASTRSRTSRPTRPAAPPRSCPGSSSRPARASPDPARAPRRPSSGSTRPPSAPSTSGTSARPPPPPSSSATWRAPTSAPCSPEASAPGRATPGSPTRSRRSPPTTPAASSSSTGPAPSRRSCSSAASAPTGTTGSGPPRSSARTASAAP